MEFFSTDNMLHCHLGNPCPKEGMDVVKQQRLLGYHLYILSQKFRGSMLLSLKCSCSDHIVESWICVYFMTFLTKANFNFGNKKTEIQRAGIPTKVMQ